MSLKQRAFEFHNRTNAVRRVTREAITTLHAAWNGPRWAYPLTIGLWALDVLLPTSADDAGLAIELPLSTELLQELRRLFPPQCVRHQPTLGALNIPGAFLLGLDGQVAGVVTNSGYYGGWGIYDIARVQAVLQSLWAPGTWMQVSLESSSSGFGQPKLEFAPVPRVEIVGEYLSALRGLAGSTTSFGVVGPTGSGKTAVLCDLLRNKRVLSLPGSIDPSVFRALLRLFTPDVVLLDDVPLKASAFDVPLARMLDIAANYQIQCIFTLMHDSLEPGDLAPGSLYWPGVRPGRIEKIVVLRPPDLADRRAILRHAGLGGEILETACAASEGLTGAYLCALARRVLGGEELTTAVAMVRRQAPSGLSPKPETPKPEMPEPPISLAHLGE